MADVRWPSHETATYHEKPNSTIYSTDIDDEIKEMRDGTFTKPSDELISIREICLNDKFDKKDFGFNDSLLPTSGRNELDVSRSLFRDGFFSDGLEQPQARFAWTEEDENIASLLSEPGFGTTGQTLFGKDLDLDAALKSEMKEADAPGLEFHSTSRNGLVFSKKPYTESQPVTSTSMTSGTNRKGSKGACKVDKTDPRSRLHFVKYVKRHERTVKLWECGICSREFQHQYTLMRHLPTHTDERNFHCDTCGKSFRQLSTLSQHRAIHSTERPYTCEVCNKTFNRVSTLISHRKTHSDVKPYKCHVCPKGFHQKGNLRNHLFTHTNERPYRCPICLKGFNQQSNLVCHKNKAHPDDNCDVTNPGSSTPHLIILDPESQTDSTRVSADRCEVTSSIGPCLPSVETPSSSLLGSKWASKPKVQSSDNLLDNAWGSVGSGVIVDPIKTYHMEVALATRQTPFALLKPDNETTVLVKVVDTILPGGKQMSILVPATAEDLKVGGKIVVNNDNTSQDWSSKPDEDTSSAVQIRVPVVATVVPKFEPGGRLHLSVEEPHHAYHTALSADMFTTFSPRHVIVGEVKIEPCSTHHGLATLPSSSMTIPRMESRPATDPANMFDEQTLRPGARILSTCALPPPAPSPPVDIISMDLFEPMECIPMGPQITAVDNIDQPPPSDDSDIFIGEFEVFKHTQKIESISLSDSD